MIQIAESFNEKKTEIAQAKEEKLKHFQSLLKTRFEAIADEVLHRIENKQYISHNPKDVFDAALRAAGWNEFDIKNAHILFEASLQNREIENAKTGLTNTIKNRVIEITKKTGTDKKKPNSSADGQEFHDIT